MRKSINFVVRSHGKQKDMFGIIFLQDFENNAEVVTGATGPTSHKFSRKLMRFQRRMKSVFREMAENFEYPLG